jgi:predicted alpha/beta hydrolase family esterase
VQALKCIIDELDGTVLLVAHSMGVLTVLNRAAQASLMEQHKVRGALLVAPPDMAGAAAQAGVPALSFLPLPQLRLPCRSFVVASRNDPYCVFARAQAMAADWGAEFVDLGEAGHINAEAGYGYWPSGQRLLQKLMLG